MKIVPVIVFMSLVLAVLSRRGKRDKLAADYNSNPSSTFFMGVNKQSSKPNSNYVEKSIVPLPLKTITFPTGPYFQCSRGSSPSQCEEQRINFNLQNQKNRRLRRKY